MKRLILTAIIVVLFTGIQNINGQTSKNHFSLSESESSEIRMTKNTTDPVTGLKTITSVGEMKELPAAYYTAENMVKTPEINWQYNEPASIVCDVKVSVNTQNTFVGWELNDERVSLYKDSSTPLWERPVVSEWYFRVDMT
ncbi:MAG: hypothetical protein K8S16_19405 [Bacteroidales bacterium]|nr:hypothetical protein [Bacteroidales bacterium]